MDFEAKVENRKNWFAAHILGSHSHERRVTLHAQCIFAEAMIPPLASFELALGCARAFHAYAVTRGEKALWARQQRTLMCMILQADHVDGVEGKPAERAAKTAS